MKRSLPTLSLLLPSIVFAGPLADSAPLRITSSSIESGWFTGKARLDDSGCWMIHLDKPSKDGYTMLALMLVDRLELSKSSAWTPIDLPAAIKAQPKVCLEDGAD